MEVLFIRHGEPDYGNVRNLGLVSYLGDLTRKGLQQAHDISEDPRLSDSRLFCRYWRH